jgi:CheY-like chemotaxis protein
MTKRVLYIDMPGSRPLPEASVLRVAAGEAEITAVTDPVSAVAALKTSSDLVVLVANAPDLDVFTAARQQRPEVSTILVTECTMEQYSRALQGQEDKLIDHVIANRLPSPWTINELRVTVQKILRQDIFGINKYLAPDTPIQQLTVRGSQDREVFNNAVMTFAEENRLGQYMAKLVFGITEELLMNAVYDAPVAGGHHHYGELPRTSTVTLKPNEYSQLTFACDGSTFAIAVEDPFGALTQPKLLQYLKKVLRRDDSANLIDTKKGGAGLGLFKILYSSHALICNVEPGSRTEVIALIDIQHQVRDFSKMARSVHYFTTG